MGLCGREHLLLGKTLQTFACKLMRRVCFTAHITNDAPTTTASFADLVDCGAKAVARRHSAANHWSAVGAHDDAVIRPARGGKIERARAHVRFQLSRPTRMRKTERLRVDGPTSNKNGQATSGPAMLVQRGVHVDHQALPQTAFLPNLAFFLASCRGDLGEPNTMLRPCLQGSTRSGVSQKSPRTQSLRREFAGTPNSAAARSPWRGSRRRRAAAR